MHPAPTHELVDELVGHAANAKRFLDHAPNLRVGHAHGELRLLLAAFHGLGHVHLEEVAQARGHEPFGDIVDVLQGLLCRAERLEGFQGADRGEPTILNHRLLAGDTLRSNFVRAFPLDEGIPRCRLQQQIFHFRHCWGQPSPVWATRKSVRATGARRQRE